MEKEIKIDFVLPWVDSTDEEWQQLYKETFPGKDVEINRFMDFKLLKYWFRAVEEYAPWVNKIHFVTQGHLPKFLKRDHPKLNIVYHEDYIPKEYLPTFSSHPIELNLHRINDLAEKFVYFNDDMYLINSIEPNFFFKNGLPLHTGILRPIVSPNYYHISEVQQNNLGIINQNFCFKESFKEDLSKLLNLKYGVYNFSNIFFSTFNNAVGFHEDHMPNPILKSTIDEVWNKEYKILDETSKNKLRNIKTDVNQWLFKQWEIMSGDFYPKSIKCGKLISINNVDDISAMKSTLKNKNIKMICINDHVENEQSYQEIMTSLDTIFSKLLPDKSSFEN